MLTVSSKNEKVDVFLDFNEKFDELCFNQFNIKFQIADIERINNSIKQLEIQLDRSFGISDIRIEDGTVAFYCEPNGLTTFSSLVELEPAALCTLKEVRDNLNDLRIPYKIQLIVDGVY